MILIFKLNIMKNTYKTVLFILIIMGIQNANTQTWEDLGNLSVGGTEIGFIDQMVGYDSGLYLCSDLGLFRTTDTGNTFTNLTFANGVTTGLRIYSVFFDDTDNTLYIGGDTAIFKSTDNGASWTATAVTGSQKIKGIARSNGNLVASYGDAFASGGAYYSTDGFDTFTPSTGLPDLGMEGFYTLDNLLFLAGVQGVYGSTDDGVTWAPQGTGSETMGKGIKFIKTQNVIFVPDIGGNGLYQTLDSGATWLLTDPVIFANFCQIFDIVLANGVIYVVTDGTGCANSEAIQISADNGATWSSGLYNLPPAYHAKLGVTVDGCVFTYAPFEDKLYRLCNGLQVLENGLDKIALLPNPTDGTIELTGIERGEVYIYTVQGKLLKHYLQLPEDSVFNLSELSAGIYFIKIHNESGIRTLKLIKK